MLKLESERQKVRSEVRKLNLTIFCTVHLHKLSTFFYLFLPSTYVSSVMATKSKTGNDVIFLTTDVCLCFLDGADWYEAHERSNQKVDFFIWMFCFALFACFLTQMKHLDTPVDSVETEHAQQVSDLKSNVINLQSDSNLLKKRVDAQDALNINVSENSLTRWYWILVDYRKNSKSWCHFLSSWRQSSLSGW